MEQPIAGDELGAIKRYFATRTYDLPRCFAPTVGQMSRQAVNSPIDQCLRGRRLKNVHPHTLLHSSAAIWPTEARICGLNGIISAIEIPGTRLSTPGKVLGAVEVTIAPESLLACGQSD